jgi:hypothetical protein
MRGILEMLGRVFVFRRIAAADVSADFAEPQMNPRIARFQAIFTAVRARRNQFDFAQMFAVIHFNFSKILTSGLRCYLINFIEPKKLLSGFFNDFDFAVRFS